MTIASLFTRTPKITPDEMAQIEGTRMKIHTNERANIIFRRMKEDINWAQMGHNELHKSLDRVNKAQNIRTILEDVYEKIRNPTISEEDNQRNVEYLDSLLKEGKMNRKNYDNSLKLSAKDIVYDAPCPCGSAKDFLNCHL